MSWRRIRSWAAWLALLAGALGCWGAIAGEVQDRVQARGEMKVCIWPDYQRISFRDPRSGQLSGLDIDLAAALASDLRAKLRFVDSSFVTLVQDLQNNRCDVAMFGIAMLPQRMEQLQFATPYLQSDIYAVTTRTSRIVRQWSDIDQPGVLVGVLAITGFVSGNIIIGFAWAKESVPLRLMGTASGVANMGPLMGGMFLQPAVGWMLDRQWTGAMAGGARLYEAAAWTGGFVLLAATVAASLLLLTLARETFCRQAA